MTDGDERPAGVPHKTSVLGQILQVLMVLELVLLAVSWLWGLRFGPMLGRPPIHFVVICCVALVGLPAAVYYSLMRVGKAHNVSLLLVFAAAGTVAASQLPSLYNRAMDKGAVEMHRTKVVDIAPSGEEEHWVEVASWVRPGETVEIDAGDSYYSLGLNSTVEVGVKPGALGAPWIVSLQIIREPLFDPQIDLSIEVPYLESLPPPEGPPPAPPMTP